MKQSLTKYDIIIIGAGASGLMAAAIAGQNGAKVLLLEKMERPGKKLLITGNGRCNITNTASISETIKKIFPNGKFLRNAFSKFFNNTLIQFLENNGVKTKVEEEGKVYPVSNKASEILNMFMNIISKHDIEILYNCRVHKLLEDDGAVSGVFAEHNNSQYNIFSKSIILCTGGKSYPSTGSSGDGYELAKNIGHSITQLFPSMVSLTFQQHSLKELQGLTLKNISASLWIDNKKKLEFIGSMIFTHFGVSGPLIHQLSREAVIALESNRKVEILLDFLPSFDIQKLDQKLISELNSNGKKLISSLLKNWIPIKLTSHLLAECHIENDKECNQISAKERQKLKSVLKNLPLKIDGHRGFKEAIVTSGGISINEIDSKTMQSKIISNLFFAGEVIDLDGETGGYNLQIAFSTAWLAANSSCKGLKLQT